MEQSRQRQVVELVTAVVREGVDLKLPVVASLARVQKVGVDRPGVVSETLDEGQVVRERRVSRSVTVGGVEAHQGRAVVEALVEEHSVGAEVDDGGCVQVADLAVTVAGEAHRDKRTNTDAEHLTHRVVHETLEHVRVAVGVLDRFVDEVSAIALRRAVGPGELGKENDAHTQAPALLDGGAQSLRAAEAWVRSVIGVVSVLSALIPANELDRADSVRGATAGNLGETLERKAQFVLG